MSVVIEINDYWALFLNSFKNKNCKYTFIYLFYIEDDTLDLSGKEIRCYFCKLR